MLVEQQARTAWGAMQTHGYSPDHLTHMLGVTEPNFTQPLVQQAIFALADKLAATRGPCTLSAQKARDAGYLPIMAYDGDWEPDAIAVPTSPEGAAVELAGRRWEIVARMADGQPTNAARAGHEGVWSERTCQRFRRDHMTTVPADECDETRHYQRDTRWVGLAAAAEGDVVGHALQHGLMQLRDLHPDHPHRRLVEGQGHGFVAQDDQMELNLAV